MPDAFQRVQADAEWAKKYGYSRALRAGNLIFFTGTAPITDDGSTFAPGDAFAQAERCYEIIDDALRRLGATRCHIVRSRMFVTDISRSDDFGRAHRAFFEDHHPCLTMVGISALVSPDMLVEIEVEAVTD